MKIQDLKKTLLINGSRKRSYLVTVLFWNPLLSAMLCLVFWCNKPFLRQFLVSWFIANVVTSMAHVGHFLIVESEKSICHLRRKSPPIHSRSWHSAVAFLWVMPGLYIAFNILDRVAPYFGLPHGATADDYVGGLFFGAIVVGFFLLMKTQNDYREKAKNAEIKLQKIENERLQAQISALTAQMNPHLLFNALNTVASLIPTNPQKAEEMILKLSELYRGVLESSRKHTHPLGDELRICEAYLSVEQARFGDRLRSQIKVDPALQDIEIPALVLQPLVENAIRHGLSSRIKGGEVHLGAQLEGQKLKIMVEDNGVGFGNSPLSSGSGTALKNCKERMSLHFGQAGSIVIGERAGGGTVVTLELPSHLQLQELDA